MAGRIKPVNVNMDEAPGVAERFAVQGIPTLLVMRGGGRTTTGAQPEPAFAGVAGAGLAAEAASDRTA